MIFDDLLLNPGKWLAGTGSEAGIVISSRVRLARNLKGFYFGHFAPVEMRRKILEKVFSAFEQISILQKNLYTALDGLSSLDRNFLFERHLISRELVEGKNQGLLVDENESLAIMVNEEDHLRLQSLESGLEIEKAAESLNVIDDALSRFLEFSFSPTYGYLTVCPTNVGTALRTSVLLHLPALTLTKEINGVFREVARCRMAIRGFYGEGSEAEGNFYQISNQVTLGISDEETIREVERTIRMIVEHEKKARCLYREGPWVELEDKVWRAYAALKNARLLTSHEALQHLSFVRMGMEMDILPQVELKNLNYLQIISQPAHLQKAERRHLEPMERDQERARLFRERL